MDQILEILRRATEQTDYEGRLYLVGGVVRDSLLGTASDEDIDVVLEGDAAELAAFLYERGVAEHPPVTYPRFGTAMVSVCARQVEFVGARRESYDPASRKPSTQPGTLNDDVLRRDFTINTLLQNLHDGRILDLTGMARTDIQDRIIRTPQDPLVTFEDDPLRMLRAVRFAVRLGFSIHRDTYKAISAKAPRLRIISGERIRDEFIKIVMTAHARQGLQLLIETGLLQQFAPELAAAHGVLQNKPHVHDVWQHSLKTLELIPLESGITLRLAALVHDVGKPVAKTGSGGDIHFYGHQSTGAEIARRIMHRLRFSSADCEHVAFLILMHMRVGEYNEQWTDSAVRRLIRDAGHALEDLITLTAADAAATNADEQLVDLDALRARIEAVKKDLQGKSITSPLSGREIMALLQMSSGPEIGEAKKYLEEQVVEGNLQAGDKEAAAELLLRKYGKATE